MKISSLLGNVIRISVLSIFLKVKCIRIILITFTTFYSRKRFPLTEFLCNNKNSDNFSAKIDFERNLKNAIIFKANNFSYSSMNFIIIPNTEVT